MVDAWGAALVARWKVCGGVGRRLGPHTGSLAEFKSFDEVLEAYDKQMHAGLNV